MDVIKHFCSGTERISINTDKVECLDTQQLNIDFKKDSIKRFRISGNGDCFFSMELIFAENITLKEQIKHMHTIELFYPELFDFENLDKRLDFYSLKHDLDILPDWTNSKELKQMIAKTVKYNRPTF